MSDTNDKKPNPNLSDWQSPAATPQQGQAFGHVAEDPLAALERIVSEGQPAETAENFLGQLGSGDDLRALEEELLKELRGQQAPLVQPAAPPQPTEPVSDEGYVPHAPMPTSDHAAAAAPQPAVEELPPLQFGSAPSLDDVAPAAEPVVPEPHYDPAPAPMADPAPAPLAGPNLNFGLARDGGVADSQAPAAPAPEPVVDQWAGFNAQPVAPAHEEAPAVTSQSNLFQADEPRTGSYGQLTDPMGAASASVEAPVEPEPAPAVEPNLSWPQAPSTTPEPQVDLSDALAQAVSAHSQADAHAPIDNQFASSAPSYAEPQVPAAPSAPTAYARPAEPVVAAPVEPVAPVAAPVQEPVAPAPAPIPSVSVPSPAPVSAPTPSAAVDSYVPSNLTQEGQAVEDPYAAFNQPVASQPAVEPASAPVLGGAPLVDPMAAGYNTASQTPDNGYYQAEPVAAAPAVNVSGQSDPAAYGDANAYATGYEPAGQDAHAQQGGYADDQLYAATPMSTGPHGTYSDPAVSQAAAESMPYLSEEGGAYHDAQSEQPAAASKGRKGLLAAGVALGIAVIGGAVVWGFTGTGSDNGEAPVLVANTDPVKEAPQDPGGKVIPHQNKEVYDRIDGTKSDEGPGNLMPATEKPLAMSNDGKSPRVISLSGGETSVPQQPTATDNAAVATPSNERTVAAPKKVRTVIVRPDGTIVKSSEPSAAPANNLGSVDQQMMAATPSEQAMGQSLNAVPGGSTSQGTGLNSPAGQLDGDSVTTATLPKRKPSGLVNQQASVAQPAQPVVAAPAQPAAVAAPAPVARTTNQPLSLLPPAGGQQAAVQRPAQPAAPAPAASSGGGGYTVQVTSQRTPEQARASYANIQSRLAGVLGGYQPDIKRADLGSKGIYYRVRVGSFSDRSGATSFCQSIKAAGGDCLVARQ